MATPTEATRVYLRDETDYLVTGATLRLQLRHPVGSLSLGRGRRGCSWTRTRCTRCGFGARGTTASSRKWRSTVGRGRSGSCGGFHTQVARLEPQQVTADCRSLTAADRTSCSGILQKCMDPQTNGRICPPAWLPTSSEGRNPHPV